MGYTKVVEEEFFVLLFLLWSLQFENLCTLVVKYEVKLIFLWHSGAIATAGVLVAGLVSFRQGNFRRSQMLMRTRVGFQAATVALLVGSVYLQGKA